jgi:hypothetical protein
MTKKSVYADKFFDKKMKPGMMGEGFIGIVTQGRKEKVKKPLFPKMDDFLEDD